MTAEVRIKRCLLRDRRRRAGLTQQQVAERLGVSKSRISEYENSEINMSIITAKKLAVICGCDINELFIFEISPM